MNTSVRRILFVVLLFSVVIFIGFSAITAESSMQVQTTLSDSVISMSDGAEVVVIPIERIKISTSNTGSLTEPVTVEYTVTHEGTGKKATVTREYQADSSGEITATETLNISKFSSSSYPVDSVTSLKIDVKADHPTLDAAVDTTQFQVARGVDNTNCNTIKQSDPNANSGVYAIQPEGVSSEFNVYCDMETDGGGWTLVMTADDDDNKFSYSSSYWTDKNTLNADDANPFDDVGGSLSDWESNGNNLDGPRKYKSFYTVSASDMRLEFGNPNENINFQGSMTEITAYDVFRNGEQLTFGTDDAAGDSCDTDDAHGVVNHPSVHPSGSNGNTPMPLSTSITGAGVNIESNTGLRDSKTRFGVLSEEDANDGYGTPAYSIGDEGNSIQWNGRENEDTSCLVGNNDRNYDTSGALWVR